MGNSQNSQNNKIYTNWLLSQTKQQKDFRKLNAIGESTDLADEESRGLKPITVPRRITIKNISSRLTADEKAKLIQQFHRLQENQLINKYVFRMEVLGAQVPDVISERLFCIFATQVSVQGQVLLSKTGQSNLTPNTFGNQGQQGPQVDGMSFEDFLVCYLVFKYQEPEEMGQVNFEMLKLSKDQESINRDDMVHFCKRIAQLNDNFINLFYQKTLLDPRIQITKEDFMEVYEKVAYFQMFKQIPEIADGFKQEHLNILVDEQDESAGRFEAMLARGRDADPRGLTEIQLQRYQRRAQADMDLGPQEMESIREFFDEEIRGRDANTVVLVYKMLFRDIASQSLKIFLINKITKFKGNDFEFFHRMVGLAVKPTSKKQHLEFIFDIFSDFDYEMTILQFEEVCSLLNIEASTHQTLEKEEFIDILMHERGKYDILADAKCMFIATMGVKCEGTHIEQLTAVLTYLKQTDALDGLESEERVVIKLEQYIRNSLDKDQTYYAIEKDFWDSWTQNPNNKFAAKKQLKTLIDNQRLLEPYHQKRLKDGMVYGIHFVVVPKYIFKSLSTWYQCNATIERNVHCFKRNVIRGTLHQDEVRQSYRPQSSGNKLNLRATSNKLTPRAHAFNMTTKNKPQQEDPDMVQGGEALSNYHKSEKSGKQRNGSITSQAKNSQGNFTKIVADMQIELDVYPRLMYFQQVSKDGSKPYLDLILGDKIDINATKQHFKKLGEEFTDDNTIPLYELSISKKATLDSVLKHFTEVFAQPNPKKARLLVDDQVISGLKLTHTIEEQGIQTGQVIYIEFLLPNNSWPTDNLKQRVKDGADDKAPDGAAQDLTGNGVTVGLFNMGNTCYMNSALQCITNIRILHEYYVKDKLYMKQINFESKLGYRGELVTAFANLMQQMWDGRQVVVPKGFKHTIGKINDHFRGDDQQDAQEYLNFLIDGLHEETNLRRIKPYIENPDSDGRDLIELGLESWSNSLRRDWSFIFFAFYGQLKSTLECLTCKKESTNYEVFTSIPVSLAEPSQLLLNIIVHRLPSKIKNVVMDPRLRTTDDSFDHHSNIEEQQSQHSNRALFQKNYTQLTNDQPIHICIQVDKNIKIRDLIQKIMEVKEVNIDPHFVNNVGLQDLILYSKSLGSVRGVFDPNNKLTQYKLITNELHAQEVVSNKGKQFIRIRYLQEPELVNETSFMLSSYATDPGNDDIDHMKQNKPPKVAYNKMFIFNNHALACDKFKELVYYDKLPEELITVAYHRRFVKKESTFGKLQPQLLASPILLLLPRKPTGRRIYEEVWALAHNILKKESALLQDPSALWWNNPNWREMIGMNRKSKTLQPFVLKMVDRQGYSCAKCNWVDKCSGCIIEPSVNKLIPDFLKISHIAIEWDSKMIEEEYNPTANEIMRHPSINQFEDDVEDQIVSLEKCLKQFHDIEQLPDTVYCRQCKTHKEHQKSYETFRPPPILTIQLKRFKRLGDRWRKLSTLIDFPIKNFDISNYVQDYQFLASQEISCSYDLCCIVNHYGSLTFGHYISVVKNPYDNKWYKYDDQFRVPISENQIPKDSAYILFYIRKDIKSKKLNEILPEPSVMFPGKPVRTRHGDGFILGAKFSDEKSGSQHSSQKFYYVMIKGQTYELSHDAIVSDLEHDSLESTTAQMKVEEISKAQQKEAQELESKDQNTQSGNGVGSMFKKFLGRSQKVKAQIETIKQKDTQNDEEKKALYNSAHYKNSSTIETSIANKDHTSQPITPQSHGNKLSNKQGATKVDIELGQMQSKPEPNKINDLNWTTNQSQSQMMFNSTQNEKMPLIQASIDDEPYFKAHDTSNSIVNSETNSPGKPKKRKKKKKKKLAGSRADDLDSSAILRQIEEQEELEKR